MSQAADVKLLNPERDDSEARAFMDLTRDHLARQEQALLGAVLDREKYLQTISAYQVLERLMVDMQREYDRRYKV